MQQTLSEINKKLRLAMDGANSSSMKKKGLQYKTNFGVPIMVLRQLAKQYHGNSKLAEVLWAEEVRELKILATMIQPSCQFKNADIWVKGINNLELAEQICMNLLQEVPDAEKHASRWICATQLYVRICGFLLYARLFMKNIAVEMNDEAFFHAVFNALGNESLLTRNAALTALKRLGRQSPLHAKSILAACENQISTTQSEIQFFYDELKFEFEFLKLTV